MTIAAVDSLLEICSHCWKTTKNETRNSSWMIFFPMIKWDFNMWRTCYSTLRNYSSSQHQNWWQSGKYLVHLKQFYECINDHSIPFHEKILKLESVESYFRNWKNNKQYASANTISSDFAKCLSITVLSLKKIGEEYREVYNEKVISVTSILQTLVVENFFSIIWRKCRYPNLWLYSVYEKRALDGISKEVLIRLPIFLPESTVR